MNAGSLFFLFVLGIAGFIALIRMSARPQLKHTESYEFIRQYSFPEKLKTSLKEKYPHLSDADAELVLDGLRQYFAVCWWAGKRFVSMPSQAVDVMWHEFILFTKQYREFCQTAFKRFLDHTPAEAMTAPRKAQAGIRRAWQGACLLEGINRRKPADLPLLFALDSQLKIPDGFVYNTKCDRKGHEYCAGHIGCGGDGSGCGGGCSSCGGD